MDFERPNYKDLLKKRVRMKSSLRGTHIVYVINFILLFILIKILFFHHKRQDDRSNVRIIKQVRFQQTRCIK